ncbi:MAG TPA: DUF4136 domain-containing protein [Candidatus Baltobacteraceae bacterium]|nr:DUF4136 domain-containing protein [Candidatus Baltobacteraceae bacterium]
MISLTMVVAGCSHKDAEIYRNPEMAIRPTASYALTPTMLGARPEEFDPRVNNALVHERIRAAITATLGAKGYRQSAPEVAEFLVRYHVGVRTAEHEVGGFVSHRNPAAPSRSGPAAILTVTRAEVTEGELVIELVERQTGAVAYRAEVHDDDVTPWDASEWVIASAVRGLLQDL